MARYSEVSTPQCRDIDERRERGMFTFYSHLSNLHMLQAQHAVRVEGISNSSNRKTNFNLEDGNISILNKPAGKNCQIVSIFVVQLSVFGRAQCDLLHLLISVIELTQSMETLFTR